MAEPKIAQDSLDPKLWIEDQTEEIWRSRLSVNDSAGFKRKLYPFRGRLRKPCPSSRLNQDTIIPYVRFTLTPSIYPLEAWIEMSDGSARKVKYNSTELEPLLVE